MDHDALVEGLPFEDDPALFEYLFDSEAPVQDPPPPSPGGSESSQKVA